MGSLNSALFSQEDLPVLAINLVLLQNSLGFDICAAMDKPENTKLYYMLSFKFYYILPFMIEKETNLFLLFLLDIYMRGIKIT
jgi:hypothetical protein